MNGFKITCGESKRDEVSGIEIAILILSAISVAIGIVRLIYDVFGDNIKNGGDLVGYERYDYDPSDICDCDDELDF